MVWTALDADVKTKHTWPQLQALAVEIQDVIWKRLGGFLVLCNPDRPHLSTEILTNCPNYRLHLESDPSMHALRPLHKMVTVVS